MTNTIFLLVLFCLAKTLPPLIPENYLAEAVFQSMIRTSDADVRLARHHFFSGDYTAFDNLWSQIPGKYDLNEAEEDEFERLGVVYDTLRAHLQTGGRLDKLPASAIEALREWASHCDEPGFIAKEVLRRNGRRAVSECDGTLEERQQPSRQLKSPASNAIRLYPNPAQESVFIELPEQIKFASFSLYALDGRLMLQKRLAASSAVEVSNIPQGIYFCRITDDIGSRFHSTLIISR